MGTQPLGTQPSDSQFSTGVLDPVTGFFASDSRFSETSSGQVRPSPNSLFGTEFFDSRVTPGFPQRRHVHSPDYSGQYAKLQKRFELQQAKENQLKLQEERQFRLQQQLQLEVEAQACSKQNLADEREAFRLQQAQQSHVSDYADSDDMTGYFGTDMQDVQNVIPPAPLALTMEDLSRQIQELTRNQQVLAGQIPAQGPAQIQIPVVPPTHPAPVGARVGTQRVMINPPLAQATDDDDDNESVVAEDPFRKVRQILGLTSSCLTLIDLDLHDAMGGS